MSARIPPSQQNHDREVCRLATTFSGLRFRFWSSCSTVENTADLPALPFGSVNFEPDLFLPELPPTGETRPLDWLIEVETSETAGIAHTRQQLSAFTAHSRNTPSRVVVLVPSQDINTMRTTLASWRLTSVQVNPWGWPQTC